MRRLGLIVVLALVAIGGSVAYRADASHDALGVVGQVLSPFQSAVSASSGGVGDFFAALSQVNELYERNQRLAQQVEAQEALKSRIIELERENHELRQLLGFVRERPDDQFLPARIIARDPLNVVQAVTIDRGRQDGVRPGMVVVTPLGLVGRVQRVTPSTAIVVLITDTSSSVSALVQGSRARGIVDGQRANYLLLRHVEKDRPIKTGDLVVTSTLGGSFPEGLPIGQVEFVSRSDTSTFQTARIVPVVDFGRLEDVLVLISFTPTGYE